MTNRILAASALAASFLVSGCDDGELGKGSINVQYDFQGFEMPSRVSIYLIPSEVAVTCDTLSGDPFNLATDSARSLPLDGDATFVDLDEGSTWTVVGVGALDGARVAYGCVDEVEVVDGETSFVPLTLENDPLDIQGAFLSSFKFNSGLPIELIGAVLTYDLFFLDFVDFVCVLVEECADYTEDERVALATEVLTYMSSLRVEVEWSFRQSADLIHGEMTWRSVEGVVIDPEKWTLTEGSFSGEIPGSTQAFFYSSDLRIKSDQLTLFILEEVMHHDVVDDETLVTDNVLPDMVLRSGQGLVIDDDFTGQADRVNGVWNTELDFTVFGFVHQFDIEWTAYRMQPE